MVLRQGIGAGDPAVAGEALIGLGGLAGAQRCDQCGYHLMRRSLLLAGHTRTLRSASARASR